MKREEKNMLTRQQIISSAMKEFGRHSFTEASLNTICKEGNISKGIIYHYFKDKDELYLECVKECLDDLTEFLIRNISISNHVEQDIENYLSLRHRFFNEHPDYTNLFTNAVLLQPNHLKEQIMVIKSGLDKFNFSFYEKVLKQVELKRGISLEEAIDYFSMFQESFNYHFKNNNQGDFIELFNLHELKLSKFLKIMFYGIAEEKDK